MFDYESLRLIWWVLIGVLLVGFAVTDGFDMGVAALSPVIGKSDTGLSYYAKHDCPSLGW